MNTTPVSEAQRLDWALRELQESVARLALEPEAQITWLKELGTYPIADELALEFDDAYKLAGQLVEAGMLSPSAYHQLETIDRLLADLSDSPEGAWLPEALVSDIRWRRVRETAATLSGCLG